MPKLIKGSLVISLAGREKGFLYVALGTDEKGRILIADGKERKLEKPKPKNIKHLNVTAMSISLENLTNKQLRHILRGYQPNPSEDRRLIKRGGCV